MTTIALSVPEADPIAVSPWYEDWAAAYDLITEAADLDVWRDDLAVSLMVGQEGRVTTAGHLSNARDVAREMARVWVVVADAEPGSRRVVEALEYAAIGRRAPVVLHAPEYHRGWFERYYSRRGDIVEFEPDALAVVEAVRYHLGGNGLVPQVACLAFTELATRANLINWKD